MSIPSNPTVNTLVLEGLYQAGETNPSASLVTRASTEWMEEIKNDIWQLGKKPKVLQVTSYTVIPIGQSRFAYPSDYSSDIELTILYGTDQGIAQSGSINSITLASNDMSGTNVIGKEILIMTGVGTGSYSQIVAYNSITKVASMVPNWTTAPIGGSTYMIVDIEYPVETRPVFSWERQTKLIEPLRPRYLYPIGDVNQGYFIFNTPPDVTYGGRLRYYADITQIDMASALFSTLLRRWRNMFVQGIKMKKLQVEDDDRVADEQGKYKRFLQDLIFRENYGSDISNITDLVTDYW
jgi:hypothetical protein